MEDPAGQPWLLERKKTDKPIQGRLGRSIGAGKFGEVGQNLLRANRANDGRHSNDLGAAGLAGLEQVGGGLEEGQVPDGIDIEMRPRVGYGSVAYPPWAMPALAITTSKEVTPSSRISAAAAVASVSTVESNLTMISRVSAPLWRSVRDFEDGCEGSRTAAMIVIEGFWMSCWTKPRPMPRFAPVMRYIVGELILRDICLLSQKRNML